ncbi:Rna15p CYBJADRAFT_166197 [Cyberlindnera jadinii NRRL Y-1542]|uniref:RRM domain-containing protein n=1 Tax=Cyberlindnera jadinii (strain ATCC 18201 / CBS 1600 / BCRC 20928 / JCM 3617 / NBRC 0987 / NRRL Y-1542) TaxID=983966 RepID=A0A1E4S7L9_CYBJN|nr:hypothetical protein CYBJADRAFT_166197 [Cyberlindnera jadinii NRRL Y-1542]ODV75468.1 hypothetical protein CYBJADRAFT_166197 [Cyberlindnera jadinii NRRL Y-1542]
MMFDKDTGRSKGYAFVEYMDVETASSAVRNLNNYAIGNRQLKCDYSRENTLGNSGAKNKLEDSLPPLPSGATLQPGQSYTDAISMVINSLDKSRVEQIVKDAKAMSIRNPVLMENLLSQCPQLSYAIVEALFQTQKVDPNTVASILLNNATSQQESSAQPQQGAQQSEAGEEEEELSTEQRELIKQVLEIPDEDLNALPEEQRESILQIKETYKNYANL